MNHISSILKYLCKQNATILITNLAVRNCDFTNKINGDLYCQHIGEYDYKPAIGKYWIHIPNTRLMLSKTNIKQEICVNISKSIYLTLNEKCVLHINDCGVS